MTKTNTEDAADIVYPLLLDNSHMCTERLYHYFWRQFTIFDFFYFGLELALQIDRQRLIAAEALAEGGSKKDEMRLKEVEKNKDPAFKKLQSFSSLQSENICIRAADNFICYLSEIIQSAMRKKPELLKSNEQVRIEDILRFSNQRDLISFLVDRKLNELTYGGIREIEKFLEDRTGITLVSNDEERATLSFAIELRNIYTHNRGVVNDIFVRRLSGVQHGYKLQKGKRFHAEFETVIQLSNNMASLAIRLDDQFNSKFKLKTKRYATWHRQFHKSDPPRNKIMQPQ